MWWQWVCILLQRSKFDRPRARLYACTHVGTQPYYPISRYRHTTLHHLSPAARAITYGGYSLATVNSVWRQYPRRLLPEELCFLCQQSTNWLSSCTLLITMPRAGYRRNMSTRNDMVDNMNDRVPIPATPAYFSFQCRQRCRGRPASCFTKRSIRTFWHFVDCRLTNSTLNSEHL